MLGPSKLHKKQVVALKPHLLQDTSFPHLVSFSLAPPILTLLIGISVIAQVPSNTNNSTRSNTSNNNNNNIDTNTNTSNKKKPKKLKIKKNLSFSTLRDRKEFF